MINDEPTMVANALPTEIGQPVDYPSTPQAWSVANELPTVRMPLWRNPWTRVWGVTAAAVCAVGVAAYIAGASHTTTKTIVQHAPPLTETIVKPVPPNSDAYLSALQDRGIRAVARGATMATAHEICVDLIHGEARQQIAADILNADPGLEDLETATTVLNTAQQFYCPEEP